MMKNEPSAAVARAIARSQERLEKNKSGDTEQLRLKALEARNLKLEIDALEERIREKKLQLNTIFSKDLPDLMESAGTDHIGLPAEGNMPALDAKLTPFYAASIAASWDDERKGNAFKYLESIGHGDLIKTDIVISLPRGNKALAKKILSAIRKTDKKVDPTIKESVHAQTLTAWLKEQVEKHGHVPSSSELELIGGTVGRIVRLKERKE